MNFNAKKFNRQCILGKKVVFLPTIHRSLCLGGQQTLRLQGRLCKTFKKGFVKLHGYSSYTSKLYDIL